MTVQTVERLEEITSLKNNNDGIDAHIDALKEALKASGKKDVEVNPARLAQNNRSGRKMMQSYFKKRGVNVTFPDKD